MNYYIVENNQQQGPFSVEQLRARGITKETYVWAEGMSNWSPAGNVSELQSLFAAPQPAQPQPRPVQPQPAQPQYADSEETQFVGQQSVQQNVQPGVQSGFQAGARQTVQQEDPGVMPKDYKKENIILMVVSMVCCNCTGTIWLILGLLGLLESNKVASMHAIGNHQQAQAASEKAQKWLKIGGIGFVITEILSVIGWILYIILVVANS